MERSNVTLATHEVRGPARSGAALSNARRRCPLSMARRTRYGVVANPEALVFQSPGCVITGAMGDD